MGRLRVTSQDAKNVRQGVLGQPQKGRVSSHSLKFDISTIAVGN